MTTPILACVNHKGGVAKSTTAITLASAFGRAGLSVLLIDLDPQANASFTVGKKHPADIASHVGRLMLEGVEVLPSAIHSDTHLKNVSLIYGHVELTAMENKLREKLRPVEELKQRIAPAVPAFDVVIIDCPPSLSLLTGNALAAATHYIVPILSGDVYCLYGMSHLDEYVSQIRQVNPELSLLGALLISHDKRHGVCKLTAESVKSRYPVVFNTTISHSTAVKQAPMEHKTVLEHDPNSKPARQYKALAKEIMDMLGLQPILSDDELESAPISEGASDVEEV